MRRCALFRLAFVRAEGVIERELLQLLGFAQQGAALETQTFEFLLKRKLHLAQLLSDLLGAVIFIQQPLQIDCGHLEFRREG